MCESRRRRQQQQQASLVAIVRLCAVRALSNYRAGIQSVPRFQSVQREHFTASTDYQRTHRLPNNVSWTRCESAKWTEMDGEAIADKCTQGTLAKKKK